MPSSSSRPVSGEVFRRRRVLVAGVALVILALALTLVTRLSGAGNGGGSDVAQAEGSAAGGSSPGASAAAPVCSPENLTVVAHTDRTTYSSKQFPVFTIELTNAGSSTCTVNAGTSQLALVVTSGKQTVWRSSDCPAVAEKDDPYWNYWKTIAAGETLESAPFTWKRTFSDASACTASARSVTGGGAAYWLSASVGKATSSSANRKQFFLQ